MQRTLAGVILLALLVLPCVLGNISAYVAMISALLSLVVAFDRDGLVWTLRQPPLLMLLTGFALMAIAFAAQGGASFGSVVSFLPLLIALPAAACFCRAGRSDGVLWIAGLSLAGTIAACAIGGYQVMTTGARATGLENSPIHFADEAIILGFMALAGLAVPGVRYRWLFGVGPLLGLLAALLAGTRGAMPVALVLALLFAVTLFRTWRVPRRNKLLLIAAYAVLLAAFLFLGWLVGLSRSYDFVQLLLDALSGKRLADSSSASRLELYTSGLRAFFDAPIFGHGWHNQVTSALGYMSETAQAAYRQQGWGYIHNDPLGFALSAGVFGILAYVLIMASPIVALIEAPRDSQREGRSYLILTLVVGVFIAGMTDVLFMAELPKTMIVFIPMIIVLVCRDLPLLPAAVARETRVRL